MKHLYFLTVTTSLFIGLAHSAQLPDARPTGPLDATIRIDVSRRLNEISPLLYGHFMEFMFEDIKGGLWAELLRNRGFEIVAPRPSVAHYWERYPDNRNDDNALSFGGERFGLSEAGYPPTFPNRALVVGCTSEDRQPRGVYQDGIPLRKGVTYRGSVWLRGVDLRSDNRTVAADVPFAGRLRVTVEENTSGGKVYAQQELKGIGPEWRRFEFELLPGTADPQSRFTIQILGRGVVWVDQVSLMPGDSIEGARRDVFEGIRELRPAFLRWPGGNVAQDYHWKWGIGPRDQRPAWVNMSWGDEPEPADFGTFEYIALCRALGAEPAIVVNVEGRGATLGEGEQLRAAGKDIRSQSSQATAKEAAEWVEYCNAPATSRYGALRARHGHPEPFGVKYWEIGNEIWGPWVRGHSDAAAYAANARRYIHAMKAVDPSIKLIAVGNNDMEWNRIVLREIGNEIDLLSVHHYYGQGDSPGERLNLMARPLLYEKFYRDVRVLIRDLIPGRSVKLAINEWNTALPVPRQHSIESALYGARLLNVFERQGDLIFMSAVSDLVNGWPGGIIQASRHRIFTTPTYSVIKAYNTHLGRWRVSADTSTSMTYDPQDPALGKDIPALDVVASVTADGKWLYLKAVNTSFDRAQRADIEITGLDGHVLPQAAALTITGPSIEAANTFEDPERISPRSWIFEQAGRRFVFSFEKHSVTILRLGLEKN